MRIYVCLHARQRTLECDTDMLCPTPSLPLHSTAVDPLHPPRHRRHRPRPHLGAAPPKGENGQYVVACINRYASEQTNAFDDFLKSTLTNGDRRRNNKEKVFLGTMHLSQLFFLLEFQTVDIHLRTGPHHLALNHTMASPSYGASLPLSAADSSATPAYGSSVASSQSAYPPLFRSGSSGDSVSMPMTGGNAISPSPGGMSSPPADSKDAGVNRTKEKLAAYVAEGKLYEAEQMYRSLSARYVVIASSRCRQSGPGGSPVSPFLWLVVAHIKSLC
jgi:hypothetical protein